MVAEMETCSSLSGYAQVGGEGSIFKGVKSINCCEDNATQSFNLDDASWCTGSEGASMEMESDTNTDSGGADVITSESHTDSVEESYTEEHSESHSEEGHTESSSTATTTTTDGGSNAGVVGLTYSSVAVLVLSAVVGGLSL